MKIRIEPLDTLFFRDGRPFSRGEDDWGYSIFPPSPGVIYGALRSLYFVDHPQELELAATDADPTAALRIRALYWQLGAGDGGGPCFPLPRDCVRSKRHRRGKAEFHLLTLTPLDGLASNYPLDYVLKSAAEVEGPDGHLLDRESLSDYLKGQKETFLAHDPADYLFGEPRVGIGRDAVTHAAAEHLLYRVQMLRLRDMSLIVAYEGLQLPEEGFLRLGGEGRAAAFTHITDDGEDLPVPAAGRYFKLYLATPAFFAGGWRPGWLDERGEGVYGPLRLKLLTAAVGKPVPIGGFDIKMRQPKPMRRAVPGGSVYYFAIRQGTMADAVAAFHGRCISEYRQKEGFGLAFTGGLDCKYLDIAGGEES